MDDFIKYVNNNPPNNITNHYCKAQKNPVKFLVDKYGDYSSCFGIKCKCGNQDLHIKGYINNEWIKENKFLLSDNLSIYCVKCDKNTLIFDSDKNGYNGEINQIEGLTNDWKIKNGDTMIYDFKEQNKKVIHTMEELTCPKCNENTFKLTVLYQYSDPEELEETLYDEELINRKQDFYDWFSAAILCKNCNEIHEIMSIECA